MKRLLYLLLLLPLSVFGAGSIAQDGKNFDQSDGTSIAVTAGAGAADDMTDMGADTSLVGDIL